MTGVPSETEIRSMLDYAREIQQVRNKMILRLRDHLEGKNPITVPRSMQYVAKSSHGFHLNAIFNEKIARYRSNPQFKCVPVSKSGAPTQESISRAAELERALNALMLTFSENASDTSWERVVRDVIMMDAGVEKYLPVPSQKWAALVPSRRRYIDEETGEEVEEDQEYDDLYRMLVSQGREGEYEKAKDEYLRAAGVPILRQWVPLERFYPLFEGDLLYDCFEIEERSLRSVLQNPLFSPDALRGLPKIENGGVRQRVVLLHYCNCHYYAYYLLAPRTARGQWPSLLNIAEGQPRLLYAFEHGIGRPLYNYIIGRGGGWKDGTSEIEPMLTALLDLSQDLDEMRSQTMTYVRRVGWPTRIWKVSAERRDVDGALPPTPEVPEGGVIPIWSDESIEPIHEQFEQFGQIRWLYDSTEVRMNSLAGSPALFGLRTPGVETGYHQQIQITQAESLDAKIEQRLAAGAVNGVRIVLDIVRALGEKVYVQSVAKDRRGREIGQYLCIDPEKLDPLPLIFAKVRDPRPQDILVASQAALQLTQVRPGHNSPLVTDAWALEELLGISDPEQMEREKWIQVKRREWLASPIVSQMIGKALGLALAEQEHPGPVQPGEAEQASPAFLEAIRNINASGEAARMGGVAPDQLVAQAIGRVQQQFGTGGALRGVGGGLPPGAPQPLQTVGRGRQILRDTGALGVEPSGEQ
jgi:hypothetical protein